METFVVVLGEELLAVRTRKGWTRRDLQRRLTFDVSVQSLATWELGSRHILVDGSSWSVTLSVSQPRT